MKNAIFRNMSQYRIRLENSRRSIVNFILNIQKRRACEVLLAHSLFDGIW